MAMKTTRWRPDSCKCVLEYSWDDSVPEAEREHLPTTVVEACERHDHDDVEVVHLAVTVDNVRKNHLFEELKSAIPDLEPGEVEYEFDGDAVQFRLPAERAVPQAMARKLLERGAVRV